MTMTSPDDMYGLNVECFEAFFQTMYERQLIWKRRFIDKKESPWTTDAIFKKFKFTNVYRELDRNSQYCINKDNKAERQWFIRESYLENTCF